MVVVVVGTGHHGSEGEGVCEKHLCVEVGCTRARSSGKRRKWWERKMNREQQEQQRDPYYIGAGAGSGTDYDLARTASSRFCEDHECRVERCLERIDVRVKGTEYCPVHRCVVEGCVKPATGGGGGERRGGGGGARGGSAMRCLDHRYCVVEGCKEWVFIERKGEEDEVRHPECETRKYCFLFSPRPSPIHHLLSS